MSFEDLLENVVVTSNNVAKCSKEIHAMIEKEILHIVFCSKNKFIHQRLYCNIVFVSFLCSALII